MDTILPVKLVPQGLFNMWRSYRGKHKCLYQRHGVHACFGSCSLDALLAPEDKTYRAFVGRIRHYLTFAQ